MLFRNRPMFLWNVEKCLNVFDNCYVSSDYQHILDLAKVAGAVPIKRPKELCGDTPNIPCYKHALEFMDNPNVIVAVQANSPTIDEWILDLTREIMMAGCQELMTCHENYKLYGSVWAFTRNRLNNTFDFFNPIPEILIVDKSRDIHTKKDLNKALKWQ